MARLLFALFVLCAVPLADRAASANFFSRLLGAEAKDNDNSQELGFEQGILYSSLSSKNTKIPMVGVAVGHAPQKFVGALVSEGLQDTKRIRLIDTSSTNEVQVAEGIVAGVERLAPQEKLEVHVLTKIWYTQLGQGRTKKAIENSLNDLKPAINHPQVDLKVHFVLNWARCYDNLKWMDCKKDEASLDPEIRQAGPDPTANSDAWKASWKYLEEIYLSGDYPIEGIGLSNFQLEDMEEMESFAKVHPHILQTDLWPLMYDHMLVNYCHKHNIHMQVHQAIESTLANAGRAPHAYHHLQKVANELSDESELDVTPAQTILAWLLQHGISVAPRSYKFAEMREYSTVSLTTVPVLSDEQDETVAHAVEAYLSGDDIEKDIFVHVTFHAVSNDLMLYWVGEKEEIRIDHIRKGDSFNETTYPGHKFRTYNAYNKDMFSEFIIDANFDEHKHIYVKDFDENDEKLHGIHDSITSRYAGVAAETA